MKCYRLDRCLKQEFDILLYPVSFLGNNCKIKRTLCTAGPLYHCKPFFNIAHANLVGLVAI